jgi:hypothetical protein
VTNTEDRESGTPMTRSRKPAAPASIPVSPATTTDDIVQVKVWLLGVSPMVPHELKSQGLQANQDVTFLTDGGDEVRALTEFVTPAGEHVLDWFHITMGVTMLTQFIRGVGHHDETKSAELGVHLILVQ